MNRRDRQTSNVWVVELWGEGVPPSFRNVGQPSGGKPVHVSVLSGGRWVIGPASQAEAVAEALRRVAGRVPQPSSWNIQPKAGILRNLLGVTSSGGTVHPLSMPPVP